MKTTIKHLFLVLGLTALCSYSAQAGTGSHILPSSGIQKIISTGIRFPEELRKAGSVQSVSVVFTVNEKGRVDLVIADTKNSRLKQDIESQFRSLVLKGLDTDRSYSVTLQFRLI